MKSISGLFWLAIAILILSASSSVVVKLAELGSMNLLDGRNPISFCNLLFAGNVIAGLVLYGIYHKNWQRESLKELRFKDWIHMLYPTILGGVLAPALFFLALITSDVINIILIATLEIPLSLFFAWLFCNEKSPIGVIIGGIISVIGVVIIFILYDSSMPGAEAALSFGTDWLPNTIRDFPKGGEIIAVIATVFSSIGTELSRKGSTRIPTGVSLVFRMIIGTIIFFIIVMILFGPKHFTDLTSPFLWEWMLVYGGIIVALGQLTWYLGISKSTAAEISIGNAFYPVAAIVFSYLILHEIPQKAQIIGGIVIILGIVISLISSLISQKKIELEKPTPFVGI